MCTAKNSIVIDKFFIVRGIYLSKLSQFRMTSTVALWCLFVNKYFEIINNMYSLLLLRVFVVRPALYLLTQ